MRAARPSPSHSSRGTIPRAGLLLALAALVALPVALLADPATEQKDADARQKLYVRRAFNDDTGPAYNEQQALAAWSDATTWMKQYLIGA